MEDLQTLCRKDFPIVFSGHKQRTSVFVAKVSFLVLIESAKKPRFAAVEVHYSRSLSPVLELLLGWCYYLFRNMAFTTDVHCVLIEIRISTRVQNSLSLSFPNTAHSR